jgi:tetratricopeptide (TPR) repeat protein
MGRVYIFILIFLISQIGLAQDDSEEGVSSAEAFSKEILIKEKEYLKFKKAFIESLGQKAIENYDKAIELLSVCESIYPDNVSMLFEKAKNHFKLKQYSEAHYYTDKALSIKPTNFWILSLSRDIYEKEFQFEQAILIQENLFKIKKSEVQSLLRLYYRTKQLKKGKLLLQTIEKESIYALGLQFYTKYFNQTQSLKQNVDIIDKSNKDYNALKKDFLIRKDFTILLQILKHLENQKQYNQLLTESETGLTLFPAQAEVYLYNGIALNNLKKYDKAIIVLEEGLDFIYDKPIISKIFYNNLIESYRAIHNKNKVNYYKKLVQKL